jgi:hypothetical protein
LRAFARAQYDTTQSYLGELGISEMLLYRGVGRSALYEFTDDMWHSGVGDVYLKMQPASSYSSELPIATAFGDNVITAVVPRERILATPATGVGCTNELEVVVLGTKHFRATVITKDRRAEVDFRGLTARDLFASLKVRKSAKGKIIINVDKDIKDADWIKMTWDLPPIGSEEMNAILKMNRKTVDDLKKLPVYQSLSKKGGPGSGHFGHAGRPGLVERFHYG